MKFEIRREKNAALIKLSGIIERKIDTCRVRDSVAQFLENGISSIVVDLSQVLSVPASFCGVLASVASQISGQPVEFAVIVAPNTTTSRILKMFSLDQVLDVHYAA